VCLRRHVWRQSGWQTGVEQGQCKSCVWCCSIMELSSNKTLIWYVYMHYAVNMCKINFIWKPSTYMYLLHVVNPFTIVKKNMTPASQDYIFFLIQRVQIDGKTLLDRISFLSFEWYVLLLALAFFSISLHTAHLPWGELLSHLLVESSRQRLLQVLSGF
jgi:hypothetical protein